MLLGKLPVPWRPTVWTIHVVGLGPIALTIGAGWGRLDIFTLLYLFSSLSPSLWETARYRLNTPKTINQSIKNLLLGGTCSRLHVGKNRMCLRNCLNSTEQNNQFFLILVLGSNCSLRQYFSL